MSSKEYRPFKGHTSNAVKCLVLKPRGQMEEPTIFISLSAAMKRIYGFLASAWHTYS